MTKRISQDQAPTLTAQQVADYFLYRAQHDGPPAQCMTNLRLQKLLYYAQAWHLTLTGDPLMREKVQACNHGPAVPSVYREYKQYGEEPIPAAGVQLPEIPAKSLQVLQSVWASYGQLSARRLREMTHSEPPWKIARTGCEVHESCDSPISEEEMRAYFRRLLEKRREQELERERVAYEKQPITAEERTIAEASRNLLAVTP